MRGKYNKTKEFMGSEQRSVCSVSVQFVQKTERSERRLNDSERSVSGVTYLKDRGLGWFSTASVQFSEQNTDK